MSVFFVFFYIKHVNVAHRKCVDWNCKRTTNKKKKTCCTTWLRWPRFPALESISAASASVCCLNTDNYKIWRLVKHCSHLKAECFVCVQVQCTWRRHSDTTVDRHGGFRASFTQELPFLLHLTQKLLVSFDFVSDRCPRKPIQPLFVCVCRGSPEDHHLYGSGCLRMGILEGINTFRLLMDFPRFSCGTRVKR